MTRPRQLARQLPLLLAVSTLGVAPLIAGCRTEPSADPPVMIVRDMYDQERVNPQGYNDYPFFYSDPNDAGVKSTDHRNMRQPPAGTMAREYYDDNHLDNDELTTGMDSSGRYVLTAPPAAAAQFGGPEALLKRGQQRYNIYCAPCHSKIGDGKGAVAMVMGDDGKTLAPRAGGFPTIPDFTQDRILHMPDGQVFNTVTHGLGNMPAYANQIPTADRWAIVTYLRALEVSQKGMPGRPPPDVAVSPPQNQGDKK